MPGIGGTEKRFSELWQYYIDQGYRNIHLIVRSELYEKLRTVPYLAWIQDRPQNLHVLNTSSHVQFLLQVSRIAMKAGRGAVFQYFMTGLPFVHNLLGQSMVISNTAGIFIKDVFPALSTRLFYWLCLLCAKKIDFVDLTEFETHRKLRLLKDKSFLTTPGTFTRMEDFFPADHKKNWIVFVGRLDARDKKNILPFVEALPIVDQQLRKLGIVDHHFFIMGFGELEGRVREILESAIYKGIPVTFKYDSFPGRVLQESKVFMSIQKDTNYPSKALVEGLAAGNLPVVTDIADSRLLAREEFSFYVPGLFSSQDLADQICRILSLESKEFATRSQIAVDFVKKNFSIEASANYYLRLYGDETVNAIRN